MVWSCLNNVHVHTCKNDLKLNFCAKTELCNSSINSWELPRLHCNDSILPPLATLIKAVAFELLQGLQPLFLHPFSTLTAKLPLERNWIILNSKGLKFV